MLCLEYEGDIKGEKKGIDDQWNDCDCESDSFTMTSFTGSASPTRCRGWAKRVQEVGSWSIFVP